MSNPYPDHAQLANLSLMEDLYRKYLADPQSVDPSWRYFFEGVDFAGFLAKPEGRLSGEVSSGLKVFRLIQAYRQFGHLAASFNPLEEKKEPPSELNLKTLGFLEGELGQTFPAFGVGGKNEALLSEIIASLQSIYCSNVGFEYMELGDLRLEEWLSQKIENEPRKLLSKEEKIDLWQSLAKAELFEQFLHKKYVGKTRFSLEGEEAMIPLISSLIEKAGEFGLEELIIGMAHRGRLNVLAQILEKPYSSLLGEFEDDTSLSLTGHDDVKYHMGFEKIVELPSGKKIDLSMAPNPSHLESVDPVILGQVRALQVLKNDETGKKISALLIHGDASFAGQGVIYETLQLMNLPAYTIGGAFHLVVNNQIGYTTSPADSRSTRYCTDIAKTFGSPVFHVNAEDPESCLWVARLAVEVRQTFQRDVFIDLVGYRKYGHNEGDEPSYTQPLEYQKIRSKPSIREVYSSQLISLGILDQEKISAFEAEYEKLLSDTLESLKSSLAEPTKKNNASLLEPIQTGVDASTLQKIARSYSDLPADFHVHHKLKKGIQSRLASVLSDPSTPSIDWSTAEYLALGSLLLEGVSIRLAGEDSQRGTFSQRHIILIDEETGKSFSPLQSFQKGRLDVINTPLTEFAGLAFEYGYSWSNPQALVLWEAQYGDFNNGAQIIIDQYLVSAEQKWNTPSSLTLLLPHAYEGAGPEHSSARLERFLQLSANENIQVVNASTPAQYFHLLRRQALRPLKKPLIVFTPKSLLRSPLTLSPLNSFTAGSFQEILDDPLHPASAQKLLFSSGKMYYDLLAKRDEKKLTHVALIRIEQLYPLHQEKLRHLILSYKHAKEILWVQEEPENAGAWNYIRPLLRECFKEVVYVGRPPNATTATGSQKKHKKEQEELVEKALVGALPQTPPKD